jgi:hypothetical protein
MALLAKFQNAGVEVEEIFPSAKYNFADLSVFDVASWMGRNYIPEGTIILSNKEQTVSLPGNSNRQPSEIISLGELELIWAHDSFEQIFDYASVENICLGGLMLRVENLRPEVQRIQDVHYNVITKDFGYSLLTKPSEIKPKLAAKSEQKFRRFIQIIAKECKVKNLLRIGFIFLE